MGNSARVLVLTAALMASTASAQTISFLRQFGTPAFDRASAIAFHAEAVYVAGSTSTFGRPGSGGAFVAKFDSTGNLVWTRWFGRSDSETARAVTADETGVYVAGSAGSLPGSMGFGDAFLRKYDPDGNELWTSVFGSSSQDEATGLAALGGAVYIAGFTIDHLPGQSNAGFDSHDVFVRRYSQAGEVVWTRQFGSPAADQPTGVAVDASGVYVAGWTEGILPGQTRSGARDCFLSKYDVDGSLLWTRQFGTPDADELYGAATDASGVYVAGNWGVSLMSGRVFFRLVRKFDRDGTRLWSHEIPSNSTSEALAIAADDRGAYVAGDGRYRDATTGVTVAAGVVRRYDSAGNVQWTTPIPQSACAYAVAAGTTRTFVAGDTTGTLPGQSSAGDRDAFVGEIVGSPAAVAVSAASLARDSLLAPSSIVSVFGEQLATVTQAAPGANLPTRLAEVELLIVDREGTERAAPLYFVSPSQINGTIPGASPAGPATILVRSGSKTAAISSISIARVSPGIFSALSNGNGPAAAFSLRVSSSGTRTQSLTFDANTKANVPIDLGPATDQIYLLLFGTGLRNFTSSVSATIGGMAVPVLAAVAQGEYPGLDQVNLGPVPRSLVGRGEVAVAVIADGRTANPVTVNIR